jgi:hypothetical protein
MDKKTPKWVKHEVKLEAHWVVYEHACYDQEDGGVDSYGEVGSFKEQDQVKNVIGLLASQFDSAVPIEYEYDWEWRG